MDISDTLSNEPDIIDSVDIDDIWRRHVPPTSIAAQLKDVVCIGEWNKWGVLVTVNEEERYAEVTARIPSRLPESVRAELDVFAHQRFEYTELDQLWDEVHDLATFGPKERSIFTDAVCHAVSNAQAAFQEAAWAYATGKSWSPSRTQAQRDESKYDGLGPATRLSVLQAVCGEMLGEFLSYLQDRDPRRDDCPGSDDIEF